MDGEQNALRVLVWFLISCECVAIIARLVLKKVIMGKYGLDDLLAIIALAFGIASSVSTALAATQGLGQTTHPFNSPYHLDLLQKRIYVSEIFHVLCLCAIKLSILVMVKHIFLTRLNKHLFNAGLLLIVVWGLSSTLVVALQCRTPAVWDLAQGNCLDMGAFWDYFSVVDIVIDLVIIVLPAVLSWGLQMTKRNKVIIIGYFMPWTTAIGAAAVSIAFTHQFRDTNKAVPISIGRDLWPWFMCAQVLRAVSMISACFPYLRQFIEAFPSGLLQPDEIRRRGLTYTDITYGYAASHSATPGGTVYYLREVSDGSSASHPPGSRQHNIRRPSLPGFVKIPGISRKSSVVPQDQQPADESVPPQTATAGPSDTQKNSKPKPNDMSNTAGRGPRQQEMTTNTTASRTTMGVPSQHTFNTTIATTTTGSSSD